MADWLSPLVLVHWTDDPPLYRLAIIVGCICLWLMWLIVYLAQVNPLLSPIVKSEPEPANGTNSSHSARRLASADL